MKKIITFLALFLTVGIANAQTDWQKEELKGKVKELTEKRKKSMKDVPPSEWAIIQDKTLVFNIQGYKTESNDLNYEKRDENHIAYEYDAKVKLVLEKDLSSRGEPRVVKGYAYDKKNNLITEVKYDIFGKPTEGTIYTYDKSNNLVKIESENTGYGTSEKTYTYNSKNQIIEENEASWHGRYRYTFEYDSKGNITAKNEYNSKQITNTVKSQYADNGKISEETTFTYKDGEAPKKTYYRTYKYDAMNNLTEYISQSHHLTTPFTTTYKYEYDTFKNWVKHEKYDNKNLKEIIERKIVYFE